MLDGFIESDTLIIKAQVQVIRCFFCLLWLYVPLSCGECIDLVVIITLFKFNHLSIFALCF